MFNQSSTNIKTLSSKENKESGAISAAPIPAVVNVQEQIVTTKSPSTLIISTTDIVKPAEKTISKNGSEKVSDITRTQEREFNDLNAEVIIVETPNDGYVKKNDETKQLDSLEIDSPPGENDIMSGMLIAYR